MVMTSNLLFSANLSVQKTESEMVSYLRSMKGAAHVMPLSRNSCMFHVCVYVCVCVSGSGRGWGIGNLPDFFPACVHMHVECVDMLFCALS
jgi:hypothetical protein